jgi:hypothetical protein
VALLPQLSDRARTAIGRLTLWLMVGIVGTLTIGLAAVAMRLDLAIPPEDSTMLAEITQRAVGDGAVFAAFQAMIVLLLLAAAASCFLAGSGVLKALAVFQGGEQGLIPARFGRTNRFLVPYWGVALVFAVSVALIVAAGGHEQVLVQFYAVSVFASFLAATLGALRLSLREGRRGAAAVNVAGAALVSVVLAINVVRPEAEVALAATGLIASLLWAEWARRGRPTGLIEALQ